jgi:hypothetical protein
MSATGIMARRIGRSGSPDVETPPTWGRPPQRSLHRLSRHQRLSLRLSAGSARGCGAPTPRWTSAGPPARRSPGETALPPRAWPCSACRRGRSGSLDDLRGPENEREQQVRVDGPVAAQNLARGVGALEKGAHQPAASSRRNASSSGCVPGIAEPAESRPPTAGIPRNVHLSAADAGPAGRRDA